MTEGMLERIERKLDEMKKELAYIKMKLFVADIMKDQRMGKRCQTCGDDKVNVDFRAISNDGRYFETEEKCQVCGACFLRQIPMENIRW